MSALATSRPNHPTSPTSPLSKTAAGNLGEKLKALPAGSPEAQYLNQVKGALERAAADPARGVTEVRLLTGHEISQVLKQVSK